MSSFPLCHPNFHCNKLWKNGIAIDRLGIKMPFLNVRIKCWFSAPFYYIFKTTLQAFEGLYKETSLFSKGQGKSRYWYSQPTQKGKKKKVFASISVFISKSQHYKERLCFFIQQMLLVIPHSGIPSLSPLYSFLATFRESKHQLGLVGIEYRKLI